MEKNKFVRIASIASGSIVLMNQSNLIYTIIKAIGSLAKTRMFIVASNSIDSIHTNHLLCFAVFAYYHAFVISYLSDIPYTIFSFDASFFLRKKIFCKLAVSLAVSLHPKTIVAFAEIGKNYSGAI